MPQGTCLDPVMFLLYINDLPTCLPQNIFCSIYADDTKLFCYSSPGLMQSALNAVERWSKRWELEISTEKTFIMPVGATHPQWQFSIGEQQLRVLNSAKDLGVTYSDQLEFEKYIRDIVIAAHTRCNYILRAFKTTNVKTLFCLFVTYVRPLLEYCTPLWSPYKKAQIDALERVQRSFTARIFARAGIFRLSYKTRLSKLAATSLSFRRLMYDQDLVYKIMTRRIELKIQDFFSLSNFNNVTRGHNFRLVVGKVRTKQFLNSFLARVVKTWNQLPVEAVTARNAFVFNREVQKYLKLQGSF